MISFIMLRIFTYYCWLFAFSLMHLMAMEEEDLKETNIKTSIEISPNKGKESTAFKKNKYLKISKVITFQMQ